MASTSRAGQYYINMTKAYLAWNCVMLMTVVIVTQSKIQGVRFDDLHRNIVVGAGEFVLYISYSQQDIDRAFFCSNLETQCFPAAGSILEQNQQAHAGLGRDEDLQTQFTLFMCWMTDPRSTMENRRRSRPTRRERRANEFPRSPDSRRRRTGIRACRERRTAAQNPQIAYNRHIFLGSHTMPSHHKSLVSSSRVRLLLYFTNGHRTVTQHNPQMMNTFNRTRPLPTPHSTRGWRRRAAARCAPRAP